ncbi:MAG: DNA polymerase III subunit beta [Firmicutes bacterium]|nr:DNA polymerase III subunit beta [Bacillota bacterium]
MQFTCEREVLVQAVSVVERAVATRDAMSILTGILIEARAERLRLVGTDLELGIECTVDAQVGSEGTAVVDARLLSQLIRKLPGDEVQVETESGSGTAVIRSGRAEFSLHTRPATDFPPLSGPEAPERWRVEQRLLRDMIRQTAFAAAVDEHRAFLNGVLFEAEGNALRLVATDSNRLAYREGVLEEPISSPRKILVPARAAQEAARMLSPDASEPAEIAAGDNQVTISAGNARLVSRLLEGQFPNYRQVLPQAQPIRTRIGRQEFHAAVERAALLSRKGPAVVVVAARQGLLTLSAREADVGRSEEAIEIVHEGEDGETAYQARFLLDVLRVIDSDEVRLEFTEGDKPGVIKPADREDYLCLIMPVRLG